MLRFILITFLGIPWAINAQVIKGDLTFVNTEILFINESIHGLLIAHRVYEDYNQSINQYVDLPSYQINRYGNKDLPEDIFEDPERWFYHRSPQEIYKTLLLEKRRHNDSFDAWSLMADIRNTIDFVNLKRKDLDNIIKQDDIHLMSNIQKVYVGLEEAIDHYDRVRQTVRIFEEKLRKGYLNIDIEEPQKSVYTAFIEIHYDIKKCLRDIRDDQGSEVIHSIGKIDKELNWLSVCINRLADTGQKAHLLRIRDIIGELTNDLKAYLNQEAIPLEYETFGSEYYYHNVKLLTQLNRYGNGYVSEVNNFFDQYNWSVIHLVEEPHFLKVVYPRSVPKEVLLDKSIAPNLDVKDLRKPELPDIPALVVEHVVPKETIGTGLEEDVPVEDPVIPEAPLVVVATHTIYVDSTTFELDLLDHRRKDGDRVSIYVNGEWIFKGISLEKKTQKLKLTIRPGEDNAILIRADNEGWMPPNTIGIKYVGRHGGVNNTYIKTDLRQNEVLRIEYQLR